MESNKISNFQNELDNSLFEAVLNGDYNQTYKLLSKGANPNRIFEDKGGISPFHIAVGLDNDLKFTKLFLNTNVNVNLR
jgi:ankyrin repeat protein